MTEPLVPRWVIARGADPAVARALSVALNLPLPLAALLAQRGFGDTEAARRFLRPSLDQLSDPLALADMGRAVEVIVAAVQRREPILVHGDYDVDGQCATALLTRGLRAAGANATPFVPHRMRDGYDFGPAGLQEAERIGARLIVTCDCGITAVDAVRTANAMGMQVVVTDHHLPGFDLPPAAAVVDPQRSDDTSGAGALCGTGIAFKLLQALTPALGLPENLPYHFLDLVALATVADVVPLVGENRVLVRHGLKVMATTRWPGLAALLRAAGVSPAGLRAGQMAFIVGPRLNAAGRVADASEGLRLLLTDDPGDAALLAARLNTMNEERQALDQRMLDEAIALVEQRPEAAGESAIVLAADGWHPGVVGIVASRVVERYGRPAFLIGFDGEVGKGSGRSISRFDLHGALGRCGDLLERFGGHRMAAGLVIRRDRIDAFRERFLSAAAAELPVESLGPEQRVDLEIGLSEANDDLERLCRHLEPCGMGNPGPVFGVRGVAVRDFGRVGTGHLRATLEGAGQRLPAIGFHLADRVPWLGTARQVDAAFRLERNEYRGASTLQARLVTIAPHRPAGPQG